MRFKILVFVFSLFLSKISMSQNNFSKIYDKIFFNIFLNNPDSIVSEFIQNYFPQHSISNKNNISSWEIISPDSSLIPTKTEHCFIFNSHPFLKFDFKEGKLELQATELHGFSPRVSKAHIYFYFNTKLEAENSIKYLLNIFKPTITYKKVIRTSKSKKILITSDNNELTDFNCIKIEQFPLMYYSKYKYCVAFTYSNF